MWKKALRESLSDLTNFNPTLATSSRHEVFVRREKRFWALSVQGGLTPLGGGLTAPSNQRLVFQTGQRQVI
jgi:hypothetical protein